MEVNTSNQDDNNDDLVQNVPKTEEIVEEENGNPGDKTKSTDDDQVVETFFGLDIDNQAQVLINYKKSIDQLFAQNKELTGVLEAVNEDRQTLKSQFQESIDQNKKLLEQLQQKPDIDSITKEVRESLHKEYDLKLELLEENRKRILAVKEEIHKSEMEKKEQQYDHLLNTALDKVKTKYDVKFKEFAELQNSKIQTQQDQFRAQLEALNQELEVWKNKASVPSDTKLGALRQDVFNYVPGTVNTNRGGAVDNTTINWDENSVRVLKRSPL